MDSNGGFELFRQLLPLLIPILILEIGLVIYALFDLVRRDRTRGPKWLWAVVIVLISLFGPVIYLLVGREQE
jgi:hypothetical protein